MRFLFINTRVTSWGGGGVFHICYHHNFSEGVFPICYHRNFSEGVFPICYHHNFSEGVFPICYHRNFSEGVFPICYHRNFSEGVFPICYHRNFSEGLFPRYVIAVFGSIVTSPHLGFHRDSMLLIYKIMSTCIHQEISFDASQYPANSHLHSRSSFISSWWPLIIYTN